MLNDAHVDTLLLFDCNFPTRRRRRFSRSPGDIEIVPGGHPSRDSRGDTVATEGESSNALFGYLEKFLDNIHAGARPKAPRSVPRMLQHNKHMDHNPERSWFKRPVEGSLEVIRRIKVDPDKVLEMGKIVFVAETIQGPAIRRDVDKHYDPNVDDNGNKTEQRAAETDIVAGHRRPSCAANDTETTDISELSLSACVLS